MFTRQYRPQPTIWHVPGGPAGNNSAIAEEHADTTYAQPGELRNPHDALLEGLDCRGHHLRDIADNGQRPGESSAANAQAG